MSWITEFRDIDSQGLHFKVFKPAPELHGLVAYYWLLKCAQPAPREAELMLPDGFEEIIFSFGGSYKRTPVSGNKCVQNLEKSYLVGAKNQSVMCSRYSVLNMVGVKLFPQTLAALGRFPAASIFNQPIELKDFNIPLLCELEDRIFHSNSEPSLIKQLNQGLVKLLAHVELDPTVSRSIKLIGQNRGCISISTITQKTSCHYRTLEKKFKNNIGMSPKQFAKNLRFATAFFDMTHNSAQFNLEKYGYYDPSHFSKEFRFFTGQTPRQFILSRNDLSTHVFEHSHRSAKELESNAAKHNFT